MSVLEFGSGDGLSELIRQHALLRLHLADLVRYARHLEELHYGEYCVSGDPVDRAGDALATLEWSVSP